MKRRNRMCVSACQGRNLDAGRSRVEHPASTATTSAALAGTHPKGRVNAGRMAALWPLPRREALAAGHALPCIPALARRTFDFSVSLD